MVSYRKPPCHICIVRPDVWTNESFRGLSSSAKLLWLGLASFLDCEGRAEFDAARFADLIFPGEDVDIHGLFGELRDAALVEVYDVSGVDYVQMGDFPVHQRKDGRRVSRFPDRDGNVSARPKPLKKIPYAGAAWPPREIDAEGPPPVIQELKPGWIEKTTWRRVGSFADQPTLGVLRAGEREDDWRLRYWDAELGDIDYERSMRDAQEALVAEGRRVFTGFTTDPLKAIGLRRGGDPRVKPEDNGLFPRASGWTGVEA